MSIRAVITTERERDACRQPQLCPGSPAGFQSIAVCVSVYTEWTETPHFIIKMVIGSGWVRALVVRELTGLADCQKINQQLF